MSDDADLGRRALPSLARADVDGKIVLVRADYNVRDSEGRIASDARLAASVPTLRWLSKRGARIVLLSHCGRPFELARTLSPGGRPAGALPAEVMDRLSMLKVAQELNRLLREQVPGLSVRFVAACTGADVREAAGHLPPGQALLLENTRFPESRERPGRSRDEEGDATFASDIVADTGAEVYVVDGFSVCHRDHATVTGLARALRERRPGAPVVAGLLLEREMDFVVRRLGAGVRRPYYAMIGGAKVSGKGGKLRVLRSLLERVDRLVIGGAMLYPFLVAQGFAAGTDPLGREDEDVAPDIEAAATLLSEFGERLVVPTKLVFSDGADVRSLTVGRDEVPAGFAERDVAPASLAGILAGLSAAGTVVWNGPFGLSGDERFAGGTTELLRWMVSATEAGAITVAGGGDSEAAIQSCYPAAAKRLSHISTGGGAMLAALAGDPLPGVDALDRGI